MGKEMLPKKTKVRCERRRRRGGEKWIERRRRRVPRRGKVHFKSTVGTRVSNKKNENRQEDRGRKEGGRKRKGGRTEGGKEEGRGGDVQVSGKRNSPRS